MKKKVPYFNTTQVKKLENDHLVLLSFSNIAEDGRAFSGEKQTVALGYDEAKKLVRQLQYSLRENSSPLKATRLKFSLDAPFSLLENAFASSLVENKLQIINLVSKRGKQEERSLILRAAKDEDVRVRRLATKALGDFSQSDDCLQQLLQNLRDADKVVRLKAIAGLAKTGNRLATSAALRETVKQDPSATVRRNVAGILSTFGDTQLISTFSEILKDDDQQVRLAAIKALEKIGGPVSAAALSTVLKDSSEQIRIHAIDTLGIIGNDSVTPMLASALSFDDSPLVREKAAEALGRIGAPSAHPQMIRIVKDKKQPERVLAATILALGKAKNYRDIPELISCLKSKSTLIRQNAATALGEIGDSSAISTLQSVLQLDSDTGVREAAAFALGKIGGETAIETLRQQRNDRSMQVRTAIKEALQLAEG